MRARPVLRYFGGKHILAPWIISHFPKHRRYVEPFGGAASVLMRKSRSYAEVYNDLDESVFQFFLVLRDPALSKALQRSLELTPYSRRDFELAYAMTPDPIENARRLVIRSFMGFGANSVNADKTTGFRANSNRSGTTPAHDWVNYAERLPAFTKRLQGVVIENRDAIQVMQEHDGPDTLHYVDPPYPHDVRGRRDRYRHEMVIDQHERLIDCLRSLQGKVIVSGYDHPLYQSLGWRFAEKETMADGARKRTEKIWLSFDEEDFF